MQGNINRPFWDYASRVLLEPVNPKVEEKCWYSWETSQRKPRKSSRKVQEKFKKSSRKVQEKFKKSPRKVQEKSKKSPTNQRKKIIVYCMILRFKRPPVDITLTSQVIFDFPIKVQFSICISEKIITFCVYSYWCMPRFSIICVQNHVWKLNFNNMKKKHTCE